MLNSFSGHSIFSRSLNRPLLLTRSKALIRSMKAMGSGTCCSRHFFCSWRKETIKHVGGAPGSVEATLSIGEYKLCQHLQSAQDDSHKGFAYNAEQRDTVVVATVTAITTVLVL